MDSCGLIMEKFIIFVSNEVRISNSMRIPMEFVVKYGYRLPECFFLKFRNGYELPVVFKSDSGKISGLHQFYTDFNLLGGEMLVFEFNGLSDFNVYIIGPDFTEIEYPKVVHYKQSIRPRVVSVSKGGLKFVKFVTSGDSLLDEIDPPPMFNRCVENMVAYQNFVFSNGKQILGLYNTGTGKFDGLRDFCSIVGYDDLSQFNMLLFSYEEDSLIEVSAFDDKFVEVFFPGTPLSIGGNAHSPTVSAKFEIIVQKFHLKKYCHGMDIGTEYEDLSINWRKKDYIFVYSGDHAWKLQVRHRRGSKYSYRTTIHDGWIDFRDSFALDEGDKCIFECTSTSSEHFVVRVIKKHD